MITIGLQKSYAKPKSGRNLVLYAVLWSQSWSRKEPELLAGAGAEAGLLKFQLLVPAPGQTKVVD
jgi:hypothetical protein